MASTQITAEFLGAPIPPCLRVQMSEVVSFFGREARKLFCLAIYCVLFAGLHQDVNRFPVELIEILHIEEKKLEPQ